MKHIQLTNGQNVIVDDDDFDYLNNYKWCIQQRKEATFIVNEVRMRVKRRQHELISTFMPVLIYKRLHNIDKDTRITIKMLDGNRLNCLRSNIIVVTQHQLSAGENIPVRMDKTSKYKGVGFHYESKKWVARIRVNSKLIYLGLYSNEDIAALIYNSAAKEYFGEFAKLNVI